MANAYTSPELANVEKRRSGKKLAAAGAVLLGLGVVGIVLSMILKVVWLGILGGPIGALSGIALVAGGVCAFIGYNNIKSARGTGA